MNRSIRNFYCTRTNIVLPAVKLLPLNIRMIDRSSGAIVNRIF
jgi:hypothetical protein